MLEVTNFYFHNYTLLMVIILLKKYNHIFLFYDVKKTIIKNEHNHIYIW